MRILVTGAAGMIGSNLIEELITVGHTVIGIDKREGKQLNGLIGVVADIGDAEELKRIISENQVERIIHLAALAHAAGEDNLSYDRYYQVNVECAKNIFNAAEDRPVLFISTVDVFGFTRDVVSAETPLYPVTFYGKTKALAEEECRKICKKYTIYRLSPVYTPDIKRDIEKRYYLKSPNFAYVIGKGTEYEVLNIKEAVRQMAEWCEKDPTNGIEIIKDKKRMNTVECIEQEKKAGRAKYVLHFPRWIVCAGFNVLKAVTGENKYTYLLNKAVNPLRSECVERQNI